MLERGDYLESTFCVTIRNLVPAYEEVWSKFIGHDGNGNLLPAPMLDEKEQYNRVMFSEYNYTCIESIICMHFLVSEKYDVDFTKPSTYLSALNDLISFQANSGRIRDNLIKMMELFLHAERVNELRIELEDLYQKRNNILHGKKLPFVVEDKVLLIANVKGKEEDVSKWNSSMTWTDYHSHLQFASDFYSESLTEICSLYDKILNNLKEPIFNIIKKRQINLIFPELGTTEGLSALIPPASGSNISYEIASKQIGVSGYPGQYKISGGTD